MSFMFAVDPCPFRPIGAASYGFGKLVLQTTRAAFYAVLLMAPFAVTANAAPPVAIVALGDSLTAGLGLPEGDGFVSRLQAALAAKGVNATVQNAGVSGDTSSSGLARLNWSVPAGTDAVILELGANDMLRGIDPKVTYAALDGILSRLRQRHIAVLLCGMRAQPNLGTDYVKSFESIYPDLAARYGVLLYPFFLAGPASDSSLRQSDGLHPNAAGVNVIVDRILPKVRELIAQVGQ